MIEEIVLIDEQTSHHVTTEPDGDQLPRKVVWNGRTFHRLGQTRVYTVEAVE